MVSIASSTHRFNPAGPCLLRLRSVRFNSCFTVIFIVRVLIVSHAVDGSPLRPCPLSWGVPYLSSVTVNPNHHDSPTLCNCVAGLATRKALIFEVVISQNPRSMIHHSDLPPSLPIMVSACFLSQPSSLRGRDQLREASPLRLRFISKDRRLAPTFTPSSVLFNRRCSFSGDPSSCQHQRNNFAQGCEIYRFAYGWGLVSLLNFIQSHSIVSKPICLWGRLVYLVSLLKNSDGFIGLFTETNMLPMSYLSFLKRILVLSLPVGSPASSSSSLYSSPSSSFAFSQRSVSPSAHVRRCFYKSITVLSSCGPVRLGPEDASDLVSTIFRGVDWISTSLFVVTKVQPSGIAVNRVLTHSSFAMNSLSLYLRGFSNPIIYGVWFYVCSFMNSVCSLKF